MTAKNFTRVVDGVLTQLPGVVTSAGAGNDGDLASLGADGKWDGSLLPTTGVPDGDKGDVTVSSSGTVWTIDPNTVSDSKLRDSAGMSVIGRGADASGDPSDITASNDGEVLRRSGTTLAFGQIAAAGITDGVVSNAKLANMAQATFKMRAAAAGTGTPIDGTAAQAKTALAIDALTDVANLATVATSGSASDLGTGTLPSGRLPALTGDVTSSAGSAATAIAADAVSNAKLANVATATIKGRTTAGTGDPEDLTASQVKTLLAITTSDVSGLAAVATSGSAADLGAGTLAAARLPAFTGDITTSVGDVATTLADNAVSDTKFRDSAALSVIGRSANSTGDPADIAASADGNVLRRSGTTLGFGQIATAGITNDAVDDTKIRDSGALSVIGRASNSGGDPADISAGNDGEVLRRSGTALGFGTVATAGLADDSVTNAKAANMATATFKGRTTAGTGDPEDLTATQATALLNNVVGDSGSGGTKGLVPAPAAGDAAAAKFLKADATWAVPAGGGGGGLSDGDYGDITVSGSSTVLTIDNDVVTYAKMQNISASDRLLGRDTAAAGDTEELTVSGGIEFTGAGGIQTSAFTGDVTKAAGGTATTIANDAVTDGKLRDSAALSVIGRSANSTGDPADIAAGTDGHVLRQSGTALGFGTIATAGITDDAVTDDKIRNSGALSVIGRSANSSGGPADISASAASDAVLRESGSTIGFGSIATGGIADDAVTYAKIQNIATDRLIGRDTTGTGDPESLTVGGGIEFTGSGGIQSSALTGDVTKSAGSTTTVLIQKYFGFPANGRLTLVSDTPFMTTDQTAKTTLYWTPYGGNRAALWDGSAWVIRTFSELSLSLSGYTAAKPYDIWLYDNAGTAALESTVWTDDTTRATALTKTDGMYTKNGAVTRLYLGTIRIKATGECEQSFGGIASGGTAAYLGVWNNFNQKLVATFTGDSTDSWTCQTTSWRGANNSSTMRTSFIRGLAEDAFLAEYDCMAVLSTSLDYPLVGIGLDSITAKASRSTAMRGSHTTTAALTPLHAKLNETGNLGFHYVNALETMTGSTATATFYGDNGDSSKYQNGLTFMMMM